MSKPPAVSTSVPRPLFASVPLFASWPLGLFASALRSTLYALRSPLFFSFLFSSALLSHLSHLFSSLLFFSHLFLSFLLLCCCLQFLLSSLMAVSLGITVAVGTVSEFASGSATVLGAASGGESAGQFLYPGGLKFDSNGKLYVAVPGQSVRRIVRITPTAADYAASWQQWTPAASSDLAYPCKHLPFPALSGTRPTPTALAAIALAL